MVSRNDVHTAPTRDVSSLPSVPKNPLRYRQRLAAVRSFHTGMDKLRDAGAGDAGQFGASVVDAADRGCDVTARDSRHS
jgi:hypothetical protein